LIAQVYAPDTRVFDWINRMTLRRAATIVPLDASMAERLARKTDIAAKMVIIPPWQQRGRLPTASSVQRGSLGPDSLFEIGTALEIDSW
jgi:hypothetical protein